jgi:hypothetical protein
MNVLFLELICFYFFVSGVVTIDMHSANKVLLKQGDECSSLQQQQQQQENKNNDDDLLLLS